MSLTDNLLAKYRELHPPPSTPQPKKTEEEEEILARVPKIDVIEQWQYYSSTPELEDKFDAKWLKKNYMKADDFFTNSYKVDDLRDL